MSAPTTELGFEPTFRDKPERPAWLTAISQPGSTRMLVIAFALFVLLCIARVVGDAGNLTSSGTAGTTLRLTIPIMLAGLAGIWAERVGVLNIGIEGMMILGSWFGAYGAWRFNPWVGIVFGILGGALGGLIHSIATVRFNVNHVISGVALNQLAFGATRYLSQIFFVGKGGGISQSPQQSATLPKFSVPILAGGDLFGWKSPDVLGWLGQRHRWFLIGDAAGILHGLLRDVSVGSVFALALVAVTSFVLWRTRFGLRLRSSGEAPTAAESLGVKVNRVRYASLAISGGFAGLGGAYLSVVSSSYYRQGQTGSRGFIGLATMIFGNWRPAGVLGGAALFGYLDALQLVAGNNSLIGIFLYVSFIAGLLLIYSIYQRKLVSVATAVIVGGLFLLAYITVDKVPSSLTTSAPYLGTLIVLATSSQRLRPPAMAGVPYRPGEAH